MAILFLIGALSLACSSASSPKANSSLASWQWSSPSSPRCCYRILKPHLQHAPRDPRITYFIPARYFITFLRAIYLKGIGLTVLYIEGLFLLAFALIMVTLANLKFKKKLE